MSDRERKRERQGKREGRDREREEKGNPADKFWGQIFWEFFFFLLYLAIVCFLIHKINS